MPATPDEIANDQVRELPSVGKCLAGGPFGRRASEYPKGVPECPGHLFDTLGIPSSGSEKGVFWKRGLFRKVYFLEIKENLEILEIVDREIPDSGKQSL